MPVHTTATRPLQTLTLMPTNTRPKRKSATADEANGVKESAPVEPPKKKKKGKKATDKDKEEDVSGDRDKEKEVGEKPPKKKQKRTKPDIHEDEGFLFRPRPRTRSSLAANDVILPTAPPPPPPPPAPAVVIEIPKKKKSAATISRKRVHDSPPPIEVSEFKVRKKISLVEAEAEEEALNVKEKEKEKGKEREKKPAKKAAKTTKAKAPSTVTPTPVIPIVSPPRIAPGGSSTKMILPVSDTPIIRRNQQMRKGGDRRSSVGLRGRRASSLMETGVLAEPHSSIEPGEYYKHINDGMMEPNRMKQLLAWCGRKAISMGDGRTADANAAAVARIIKEDVLATVISDPAVSNWFTEQRPKDEQRPPNPRNVDNLAKVAAIEANLAKLLAEKAKWKSLLKTDVKSTLSLSGGPDMNSLLQPSEAAFAASMQSQDLLAEARGLVKSHSGELEFRVDQLLDGVHKLDRYATAADRMAGRVLMEAEETLEKREERVRSKEGTEKLPIREVLRSIARMER